MSLKLWSIPWTTWVLWHTRLMDFWMQVSVSYLELSLGCLALNRYSFCSVYYHSAYAYWLRLEHHFLYQKKSVYYINLLVTISECRIFNLFPVFFFNLKKNVCWKSQRIGTCQYFIDRGGLFQQSSALRFPKHHKRYILPGKYVLLCYLLLP